MWFNVKANDSNVSSRRLGISSHSHTVMQCHPISASLRCSSLSRSLFLRIFATRTPYSSSESCSTQNSQSHLPSSLLCRVWRCESFRHLPSVATPHCVHARSTHSQRCTFYTSSVPSPDAQATAYGSNDNGIPYSTVLCAQSFLASYSCFESLPYWLIAVVLRVYPYHFNASISSSIEQQTLSNNLYINSGSCISGI